MILAAGAMGSYLSLGALETVEKMLPQMPERSEENVNLFVLKLFFLKPYEAGDFYPQFQERMVMARDVLGCKEKENTNESNQISTSRNHSENRAWAEAMHKQHRVHGTVEK